MGWWRIKSVETGQIKHYKDGRKFGGNARPGKDKKMEMYNGDRPADIMSKALDEIVDVYKSVWGRAPFKDEVQACFNFVANPMKFSRPRGK